MRIDNKPKIIAIDGPAASGKSTIAKRIADDLGYLYFDTGVMYRAVTWISILQGEDLSDESSISALARAITIDVCPPSKQDGRDSDILVNGDDITWKIRKPEVDANVSLVSSYQGVRDSLTTQQRRIGKKGNVVMAGRDIGTIVLPDADLKVYLDASPEVRARRRYLEILARGESSDYDELLEKLLIRDQIDSTREIAPLRLAEDAIVVNTDCLDIDQVYEQIKGLIDQWKE